MTGGAIGDRYGRKGALLGGLFVFGLGAVLGGLADSAEVILVARAAMGVAAAFVMPATLSLLIEIFPPPERPTAIAIWAGFAGGGAAIGPLLTGLFVTGWWFVPSWGWEAGFLYNVPIVAVVMVAMALWLPRSRDERPRHLDPLGAALSIVAMTALIYGIIEGPEQGWTSVPVLSAFAVAVTFGVVLLRWQQRARHPMLPLELFDDQRFSVGSAVVTMTFVVMIGFWFLFALYVQFALGYSALEAGLATMPEALTSMVVSPFTAPLAKKYGSRRIMSVGFFVLALTFAPLAFVDTTTSYWYLLGPMVLAGAGLALAMTPATNDIMVATPYEKAGIGSAVNDTARELGAALGIATLGALSTSIYRSTVDIGELPARGGRTGDRVDGRGHRGRLRAVPIGGARRRCRSGDDRRDLKRLRHLLCPDDGGVGRGVGGGGRSSAGRSLHSGPLRRPGLTSRPGPANAHPGSTVTGRGPANAHPGSGVTGRAWSTLIPVPPSPAGREIDSCSRAACRRVRTGRRSGWTPLRRSRTRRPPPATSPGTRGSR